MSAEDDYKAGMSVEEAAAKYVDMNKILTVGRELTEVLENHKMKKMEVILAVAIFNHFVNGLTRPASSM